MLSNAGDQVPVMPSSEVVGNVAVPPEHIGDTCVNVGVCAGLTITTIDVPAAHCPAVGEKL